MMKKWIVALLTIAMVVTMAACGGPKEELPATETGTDTAETQTGTEEAKEDAGASEETAEETTAVTPAADEYSFTYGDVEITLHAPAAEIVAALGEPMNYTEQASCAFEGLDKSYYYGSFYLDTYPVGEEDFVYGFWFADDSVTNEEGLYIGAPQADVEKAYGAEAFNGNNAYKVDKGTGTLTVIVENGVVTSIQYAIQIQ